MKTTTIRKTTAELIEADRKAEEFRKTRPSFEAWNKALRDLKVSPLDIGLIPNNMGINLCSVDSIEWVRQEDDQLVSLTIHFTPATPEQKRRELEFTRPKPSRANPWVDLFLNLLRKR